MYIDKEPSRGNNIPSSPHVLSSSARIKGTLWDISWDVSIIWAHVLSSSAAGNGIAPETRVACALLLNTVCDLNATAAQKKSSLLEVFWQLCSLKTGSVLITGTGIQDSSITIKSTAIGMEYKVYTQRSSQLPKLGSGPPWTMRLAEGAAVAHSVKVSGQIRWWTGALPVRIPTEAGSQSFHARHNLHTPVRLQDGRGTWRSP